MSIVKCVSQLNRRPHAYPRVVWRSACSAMEIGSCADLALVDSISKVPEERHYRTRDHVIY